ncbi:PTS system N-acetylglucosamine-specific transporter subunit IIABC [Melissococcus plutonius]|nr:PTS glucose transporter subunit IIA [Melissococcus plutonius]AIM25526.2 PTS system N-acetylglucosamine-specific transporter subunit IIABC [Melissococcus plutonius S1]KMT24576.1 PTS system N-acetylglucosamine-specific transporter subunit IIABC [Melissococcus plutonius]KMT27289.1 PTS system N-acetylglucosamine-specific transporter subunit IIABC [Melissococcus plutonius]KMT27462.1 PTS system N-acetylglucosamine-specific transporter subunit IIABC [Melissococcus plutonius]KMT29236.1 PTS system N
MKNNLKKEEYFMFKRLRKAKVQENRGIEDTIELYSIGTGEAIAITEVNDPVFANKMLGDGFAILPETGEVFSPFEATILAISPTKHAFSLKTDHGIECLIHLGIDTVELAGQPFEIYVEEGERVTRGEALATVDLSYLKNAGKSADLVIVFTNNKDQGFSMQLDKLGKIDKDTRIGKVRIEDYKQKNDL